MNEMPKFEKKVETYGLKQEEIDALYEQMVMTDGETGELGVNMGNTIVKAKGLKEDDYFDGFEAELTRPAGGIKFLFRPWKKTAESFSVTLAASPAGIKKAEAGIQARNEARAARVKEQREKDIREWAALEAYMQADASNKGGRKRDRADWERNGPGLSYAPKQSWDTWTIRKENDSWMIRFYNNNEMIDAIDYNNPN